MSKANERFLQRMVRWMRILNGWKRYKLGFCPACNSSAPEMYDCKICRFSELQEYPYRKSEWWERFLQANSAQHHPAQAGEGEKQ